MPGEISHKKGAVPRKLLGIAVVIRGLPCNAVCMGDSSFTANTKSVTESVLVQKLRVALAEMC